MLARWPCAEVCLLPMTSTSFVRSFRRLVAPIDGAIPYQPNTSKLPARLWDVFLRTFDLGFTAFGGPPVHFQIFHRRFVEGAGGKTPWIDEQTVSLLLFLIVKLMKVVVYRAVRALSESSRASIDQNAVQHRPNPRRDRSCHPRLRSLVSPSGNSDVWTSTGCSTRRRIPS